VNDRSTFPTESGVATVWTIGHSTRSAMELLECLAAYDIELVADVRRLPGSRRLPQFDAATLEASLHGHGIDYRWLPALGGRRRSATASARSAWRHPAFRAYAEHVESEEFADGLFELAMLAGGLRTAVMCAEVLWWRCHRRLIADVLVSVGFPVVHIFTADHSEPHALTPPARIVGGVLTYALSLAQRSD
jgi:uncharacterized protein (DUF488 family)